VQAEHHFRLIHLILFDRLPFDGFGHLVCKSACLSLYFELIDVYDCEIGYTVTKYLLSFILCFTTPTHARLIAWRCYDCHNREPPCSERAWRDTPTEIAEAHEWTRLYATADNPINQPIGIFGPRCSETCHCTANTRLTPSGLPTPILSSPTLTQLKFDTHVEASSGSNAVVVIAESEMPKYAVKFIYNIGNDIASTTSWQVRKANIDFVHRCIS
jgi:hypothetical protein